MWTLIFNLLAPGWMIRSDNAALNTWYIALAGRAIDEQERAIGKWIERAEREAALDTGGET